MDVLETERLTIRPFTMDDLEDVHRLLDLDLEWGGPGVSLEQRRERLQFQIALAHWVDAGCIYGDRAIVLRENQQLIGICGFRPWICAPAERALYDRVGTENTPSTRRNWASGTRYRASTADGAMPRKRSRPSSNTASRNCESGAS